MKKYKVGMVGVSRGNASLKFYQRSNRAELAALCDLDPDRLAKCAEYLNMPDSALYTDYDAFLNSDIDIVVISTPIPLHEEQVVKALEAGKHVLSEVTMANTIEGCRHIWEAAKKAKTKYMLAENYQYFHFIKEWKQYVDAGKIGRIHYAEAEYIHDIRERLYDTGTRPGESYWRTYRPPVHYCTHCLGPLMFLIGQGDYITKATAWGNKATIVEDQSLFPSTIDMQVALFETKQGRILKILRSQVTPRNPHIVTYNLYGTKGLLETGRTEGYDTVGSRYFEETDKWLTPINCNGTKLDAPLNHKFGGHGTSDYYGAQAFLDYLEFGKEPYTTVDRAVELTLPGILAHEAAMKEHVWLDVPHI